MRSQAILSLAALLGCWVGTALAGEDGVLPLAIPASQELTQAEEKKVPPPLGAGTTPASSAQTSASVETNACNPACGVECCVNECCRPCRCRKEFFTLRDYWEILRACFYCE